MAESRDNLKAGLFVVTGVVLALVVVFTLVDYQNLFEKMQIVEVEFQLSDGLLGLKTAAEVTLGDQPVGKVQKIEDVVDTEGRVEKKRVIVNMPKRYKLYQNAVIELKPKLLGSGTTLNIRSVGQGDSYEPGQPIAGGIAPSEMAKALVREMGIRDKQREQIRQVIGNVAEMSETLKNDMPEITASLKRVMKDVEPLAQDAREAVTEAKAAVLEAKQLVQDVRKRSGLWMDRIDSVTASADSSLQRVGKLLEEKDPSLRKAIDNVEAITQRARDETMDQIKAALEKADEALTNARDATAEFKSLVITSRPVLDRTLANFQLTASQLKLAAIEVRRSPWRLLYRPDDQELESDNLYDAARSFAMAAGSLDATAASLEHLVSEDPEDGQEIRRQLEYLQKVFDRFETAEKAFWRALESENPPAE